MAKRLPARRLDGLEYNPWVEFTRLAKEYDAVNLGQGFPNFPPPDFAVEAFQQATSGDFMLNQYTMAFGLVAIPMSIFYSEPQQKVFDHYIRFCFVKDEATLRAMDEKLQKWKAELGP